MDTVIVAALAATIGFAGGDTCTALFARRVSGQASMFLLTLLKVILYLPLVFVWWHEFGALDMQAFIWSVGLGLLFTAAYLGFYMALALGKDPALVGVVAGCFPASAAVVTIFFLGQPTTLGTIGLLIAVLIGVALIGLPANWRTSFKVDTGILLALVPMVCWGVFGALLNKPVQRIGTPHAWFVVQMIAAGVMVASVGLLYNRRIPELVRHTSRKAGWKLALGAGVILGVSELFQAFALGAGKQIVAVEAIIGSYPAAYFLIAHKVFGEPLGRRQWLGIGIVVISIALLSTLGITG